MNGIHTHTKKVQTIGPFTMNTENTKLVSSLLMSAISGLMVQCQKLNSGWTMVLTGMLG